MKKKTLYLLTLAAITLLPQFALSQQTTREGDSLRDPSSLEAQRSVNSRPNYGAPKETWGTPGSVIPGSGTPGITSFYARVEPFMRPTKQQKKAYEDFLKGKNTGIFRIWPLESNYTVSATDPVARIVPKTSPFYSFNEELHFPAIADIRLVKGLLQTGFAKNSFGTITALGDVSLDQVSLNTPQAVKLLNIKLPGTIDELETMQAKYPIAADANVGQAFLLRSAVEGYSDIVVALKIVEKDADGAAVIIWKKLSKEKGPKFKK